MTLTGAKTIADITSDCLVKLELLLILTVKCQIRVFLNLIRVNVICNCSRQAYIFKVMFCEDNIYQKEYLTSFADDMVLNLLFSQKEK